MEILPMLSAPSSSTVAGVLFATGNYLKFHKPVICKLKNFFESKYKKPHCTVRSYWTVRKTTVFKSNNQRKNVSHIAGDSTIKEPAVQEDLTEIFRLIDVCENQKFSSAVTYHKQMSAIKISEGSYGEIYSLKTADGSTRILKCITIDGQHPQNEIPNIDLKMVLPEIICSSLLSQLYDGFCYLAPNFPEVFKICVVRDHFPAAMMKTWCEYMDDPERLEDPSYYPRPDLYREDQTFLTIESSFCGEPLAREALHDTRQALSVITQVVSALAIAEEAYKFEHRDLHLGNVLMRETEAIWLRYIFRDFYFSVLTMGYHLYVIDFTFSRIEKDGRVYCVDLDDMSRDSNSLSDPNQNEWLNYSHAFEMMIKLFQGDWNKFAPKSNVFWLKYLIETIIDYLEENIPSLEYLVADQDNEEQTLGMEHLRKLNDEVLQCDSAADFFLKCLIVDNPVLLLDKIPEREGDSTET